MFNISKKSKDRNLKTENGNGEGSLTESMMMKLKWYPFALLIESRNTLAEFMFLQINMVSHRLQWLLISSFLTPLDSDPPCDFSSSAVGFDSLVDDIGCVAVGEGEVAVGGGEVTVGDSDTFGDAIVVDKIKGDEGSNEGGFVIRGEIATVDGDEMLATVVIGGGCVSFKSIGMGVVGSGKEDDDKMDGNISP